MLIFDENQQVLGTIIIPFESYRLELTAIKSEISLVHNINESIYPI